MGEKQRTYTMEEMLERVRDQPHWQRAYYACRRGVRRVGQIPHDLHWFIQRGRRGWAVCDTWSLDSYLARWLPDAIRHLDAHDHGVAYPYIETAGRELGIDPATCPYGDLTSDPRFAENGLERAAVLQSEAREKMAQAWELCQSEWITLTKDQEALRREGLQLFIDHLGHLWN